MKTRFITSIFIVLVTALAVLSKLLPYNIGEYIFDIFIICLTLIASFEICHLMEKSNKKINKPFTVFYAIFNYVVALLYLDKVDFSMILVIGRRRVPQPATGMMALVIFVLMRTLYHVLGLYGNK